LLLTENQFEEAAATENTHQDDDPDEEKENRPHVSTSKASDASRSHETHSEKDGAIVHAKVTLGIYTELEFRFVSWSVWCRAYG